MVHEYTEDALAEDATPLTGWYRRWRDERREPSPALKELLDRLSAHAHARLTEYELGLCHKCKVHCDRARRLAEAGEESEACRALAVAHAVVASPRLSTEARLLCQAEVAPAEAHNERLAHNFPLAHRYVQQSLELDATLESSLGYTGKIAHRMHMLSVEIALLAGERRVAEAAHLAASCLDLLSAERQDLPLTGDWSLARFQALPAGMTGILGTHIITAMVGALAALPVAHRGSMIEHFIASCVAGQRRSHVPGSLHDGSRADTLLASQLCTWLRLSLKSGSEHAEFFAETRRCLRRSRGTSLFHLTAFDAACVLAERGSYRAGALHLAQEIARNVGARTWWRLLGQGPRARLAHIQSPLPEPLLTTGPACSRSLAVQVFTLSALPISA